MDFQSRAHLPIACLNPSLDTNKSYVKGIVTLVWPYSSSNQYTSILVVEPDFRLRRKQGQVRISFKGTSARAVAKSGLTNGDEVLVALTDAKWLQAENNAATPGRGVDWELQFGEHVILQFTRNGEKLVQLDFSDLSPSPSPETAATTALHSRRSPDLTFSSTTTLLRAPSQKWSSPAFLKRKNLSAVATFSTHYDPFTEDGNSDDDRRRKKTKFGRASGQWRFSERSPSLEEHIENQFGEEVDIPERMHYSAGIPETAQQDQPVPVQLTPKSPRENVSANEMLSKSSAAQLEAVTQFATPRSVVREDSEGAFLPEQSRQKPQASPHLLMVSPSRDRKTRLALPRDQADWEEQIVEPGNNDDFHRESPGLHETGEAHGSQESVKWSTLEPPKSNALLRSPTGFLDERNCSENLAHEHSQTYHDVPVSYGDGPGYREHCGVAVSVDRSPSPMLMNSAAEEVLPRNQNNAIPLNMQVPDNVQQDDLWDDSQSDRTKEFDLDIPDADSDLQRHELYDLAETSDNGSNEIPKVEKEPSVTLHEQDVSHSDLMADPQPEFTADDSDYDASDLDEKQDLQNDVENEIGYIGQEDPSSAEQFSTTIYQVGHLPFENATRRQDQNRMEVISIGSDESEDSEDGGDGETRDSESKESDGLSVFDRPKNVADQVEEIPSPGEPNELQISVSPLVGPAAQYTDTLDQLDANDDADHSTVNDFRSDLKNKHAAPFTPEPYGLLTFPAEQGNSNNEQALHSRGTEVMSKQESSLKQAVHNLSHDSPDFETKSHLITPLATQLQRVDYAPRCEDKVKALNDDHNLPTPRDTQSTSVDKLDAVVSNQPCSLIGLLRELRSSSGIRTQEFNDLHGSQAIDVWFNSDKHDEFAGLDERQPIQNEENDRKSVSHEVHANSKSSGFKSQRTISAELDYQNKPECSLPTPLYTGFRTPLSYFAPLSSLPEYFNSTIDVMVIAVSASQLGRATKGPRDYHETVYITDPSSATSDTLPHITMARIFRPFKVALPVVGTGDAVLLRNFKVQAQKQKPMLSSTDSSAWAVFRKGVDVQIRGPQLEFGPEERGFARGLGDWWENLDDQDRDGLLNSVPKQEARGKRKEKEKPSRKSTVVHELRDGTRYMDGRIDGMDGVHELRDGTVYTDDAV